MSENRATPPVELEPRNVSTLLLFNNPILFFSSSRKGLRDFVRRVLLSHKIPQHSLPLSQFSVFSVVNPLPVAVFVSSRRAFTLIEVLVASVILFAGLGAVLKAYSMAVAALDSAGDILVSTAWLREKVAVMELQGADGGGLMPGSGRVQLDGRAYQWEVDARDQAITPNLKLESALIQLTRFPAGTPHLLHAEWAVFQDPPLPPSK